MVRMIQASTSLLMMKHIYYNSYAYKPQNVQFSF
jgi:hypothetical protein